MRKPELAPPGMIPEIRGLDAKRSSLVARGQRMLALAVARSDGALPVARQVPAFVQGRWLGKTVKDRQANLEWAVKVLRTISLKEKRSPAVETDLAEAMTHVEADRAEARPMLERLAKQDLIATPEGYAALASLRAEAGDKSGVELAMKRCRAMAARAAACHIEAQG